MAADDSAIEALRREMHVLIEGVHDHIRLVAESSAARDESIIRELREMNLANRQEFETFRNAFVNR